MTGHSLLGNSNPAFPWNSLCNSIFSDPIFRKIYFLIIRASQYRYQQIPGKSMVKSFATEINKKSHRKHLCNFVHRTNRSSTFLR